jgi:DNA-binding transcriptional MerR regulator
MSDNVIAAFSEEHVSRLTGLSKTQLRYWDQTGFFTPSYVDEDRRLPYSRVYSFKDVLALRTLSTLRRQFKVPLQHLRKAKENLRHLSDELWTRMTLYVVDKVVIFHDPESDKPREIVSGQFVVPIELKAIVSDTREIVQKLRQRSPDKIGQVSKSRYVNHNAWVIAGTRIPTKSIRQFHEAGYTTDQIIQEYPDLTPDDVDAALAHEEGLRTAA